MCETLFFLSFSRNMDRKPGSAGFASLTKALCAIVGRGGNLAHLLLEHYSHGLRGLQLQRNKLPGHRKIIFISFLRNLFVNYSLVSLSVTYLQRAVCSYII